jgi:uridine kinase
MSRVTITIEGEVGSGKSAILGKIAQLMEYLDIPITYDNPQEAQSERNSTKDNWASDLDLYRPSVHLVEKVSPSPEKPVSVPSVNELFDKRKQQLHADLEREINKKKFLDHIQTTSEIVDSWPDWKKNWKP